MEYQAIKVDGESVDFSSTESEDFISPLIMVGHDAYKVGIVKIKD